MSKDKLHAPFHYFGGKRSITGMVWARLGKPKQYLEPFAGSAAIAMVSQKRHRSQCETCQNRHAWGLKPPS